MYTVYLIYIWHSAISDWKQKKSDWEREIENIQHRVIDVGYNTITESLQHEIKLNQNIENVTLADRNGRWNENGQQFLVF